MVNVIAPIMTENGGSAWAQTIFYPFLYASAYGNGATLRTVIESETYQTSDGNTVPFLASSVIYNPEQNEVVVYAINRSLEDEMELEINLENIENYRLTEWVKLYSEDLEAVNDKDNQRIAPVTVEIDPDAPVILDKHSWNMLRYQING